MPASADRSAPATTSPGARSPPMASTATSGLRRVDAATASSVAGAAAPPASATFNATVHLRCGSRMRSALSLDLDGLAPAVPPAVGADDVGKLRLVAVGADRTGGG